MKISALNAVKNNEKEKINEIFSSIESTNTKADIMGAIYEGYTLLCWAQINGKSDAVSALVNNGGDLVKGKGVFYYLL